MLLSLQYIRGLAAMLVVYFHAVLQIESVTGAPARMPAFGEAGVDLFFILSGYVMWISTAGRDTTIRDFYHRRIIRIVPLYWGATLAAALVAYAAPQLLRSTLFDPAHVIASLAFIPWPNPASTFPDDVLRPVIIPGWTLNYEMFFYALFGLTLLARESIRPALITAVLVALVGAGFLFPDAGRVFQFYTSTLLLEFLGGVLLAVMFGSIKPVSPGIAAALLVAAFASLIALDASGLEMNRAAAFGIPALVIVFAAISLERQGQVRDIPWLSELGSASYSIYITHVFVIAGLRTFFLALDIPALGGGSLFVLGALVLSAACGIFVHRLYELPMVRLMKGARVARPA